MTTIGARSGKRRRIVLIHLRFGDNKLPVASQGGIDTNPLWYCNSVAYPQIQIVVDGAEEVYEARQVSDAEKAALWPHLLSLYPGFDEYQARTDRNIPVFFCELCPG